MKTRRGGYTLLEIVTSLLILSSLAVVGTQLLSTSLRVTHEAVNAQETAARMTSAIDAMRTDVWNAKAFAAKDKRSLHIDVGQGAVDWSIEATDLVRREGDEQRRWAAVGENCSFEIEGPAVVLLEGSQEDHEQLRLVSQLQLANRELR